MLLAMIKARKIDEPKKDITLSVYFTQIKIK